MSASGKAADAYRTIGEVAAEIGVPQHILRYWESRFPQLRPLQRAGKRRHYRPEDVALVRRIHQLLNAEGYTVKGVQQLLAVKAASVGAAVEPAAAGSEPVTDVDPLAELRAIRDRLAAALADE